MTTPSPATRSDGAKDASRAVKRPLWRPIVIWTLFFSLLIAGIVLAAVYGPAVPPLADTVN